MRHEDCVESGCDPGGQTVHVADPAAAAAPGGHLTHVAEVVARWTPLAVPAGHAVHTEEPSESLKDPSGQSKQSDADLPPNLERAVPATQNSSQKDAPVADVHEPGGHSKQPVRPATGAYDPGGQSTGCVAPTQYEPAGQTLQEYDAPAKEPEPAGHGRQAPVVVPDGE